MRIGLFWSGGKDSAWALRQLGTDVVALLTTFDEASRSIPHHGVALSDIEAQLRVLELPWFGAGLPPNCPNAAYEAQVLSLVEQARAKQGIEALAFGDIYLSDIRAYRERVFGGTGLPLLFPLWLGGDDDVPSALLLQHSLTLAREMLAGGLEARITAAADPRLGLEWVGRSYDAALLAALPEGVDPCGERGEFHTLALNLQRP